MAYVKWTLRSVIGLVLFLLLHYTLPQHDIVRVVNTYQERQDLNDWTRLFWAKPDDQSAELVNRDVQFIQTVRRKTWLFGFVPRGTEEPMVYRNEDTGWSWPPISSSTPQTCKHRLTTCAQPQKSRSGP